MPPQGQQQGLPLIWTGALWRAVAAPQQREDNTCSSFWRSWTVMSPAQLMPTSTLPMSMPPTDSTGHHTEAASEPLEAAEPAADAAAAVWAARNKAKLEKKKAKAKAKEA